MSTFGWIAVGIVIWLVAAALVVALFAGAAKHRRGGGW